MYGLFVWLEDGYNVGLFPYGRDIVVEPRSVVYVCEGSDGYGP